MNPTTWAAAYNAAAAALAAAVTAIENSDQPIITLLRPLHQMASLSSELIDHLRQIPTDPADFFDRPQLAAALEAVAAVKEEVVAHSN